MIVSRNSWHYRLNSWARGWKFVDLASSGRLTTCSYFWNTVGALFVLALFTVFGVFALGVTVSGLIGIGWLGLTYFGFASTVPVPITVSAVIVGISVGIILFGKGIDSLTEYINTKAEKQADVPKEPGFIRQFLKDRKNKVCTIVEVK